MITSGCGVTTSGETVGIQTTQHVYWIRTDSYFTDKRTLQLNKLLLETEPKSIWIIEENLWLKKEQSRFLI